MLVPASRACLRAGAASFRLVRARANAVIGRGPDVAAEESGDAPTSIEGGRLVVQVPETLVRDRQQQRHIGRVTVVDEPIPAKSSTTTTPGHEAAPGGTARYADIWPFAVWILTSVISTPAAQVRVTSHAAPGRWQGNNPSHGGSASARERLTGNSRCAIAVLVREAKVPARRTCSPCQSGPLGPEPVGRPGVVQEWRSAVRGCAANPWMRIRRHGPEAHAVWG